MNEDVIVAAIPKGAYISSAALAKLLGCSHNIIRVRIRAAGIKYMRVGGVYLIDTDDIPALMR